MDTKPLEIEAESYVKHELIKYGFKVTKPDFDTDGADLLIIDSIDSQFTRFLKIQSKGRTLTNSSHIEIPISYVENNLVLFLYVKDESYNTVLFIFFHEDITKWKTRKNRYVLNLTAKIIKNNDLAENEFTKDKIGTIKSKLNSSKIKKYTSLFVDGIFLEKAITNTIKIYKEIYPTKEFKRPHLEKMVGNILSMYDNFNSSSKTINCYAFYSKDFAPPEIIKTCNKIRTNSGASVNLYLDITNDFVCFEILEKLERTINNENIILVADDPVYEHPLNELKQKDVDITLVMHASHSGRTMFTKHKWGDISYPIASSIGLEEYEW